MRKHVESAMPKSLVRVVSVCALAAGLGACSEATRFTEAPFANPFKTAQAPAVRDPVTTGSIGRSPSYQSQPVYQGSAPSAGVSSQPLAPPSAPVAMNSAPAPAAPSSSRGTGGWVAEGGTSVVVAHGETLDVISNRYGVPRTALMSVNGLSGNTVAPGTRLTVPVYNANAAAVASRAATSVQQPVAAARQEASRLAPVAAAPAGTLRAPAPAAAAASAAKARADAAPAEKTRVAADTRSMT
ncbi:LysM peptidoglycan-binding domain-containing protein, partial [Bosea sp. TWI1241]|uniref:LysM peptidoglycan-binding domain-containing protein n=1 Tax=Bosea sp. TWI1241 TaxID=3148904 RepID=UPI003209759C